MATKQATMADKETINYLYTKYYIETKQLGKIEDLDKRTSAALKSKTKFYFIYETAKDGYVGIITAEMLQVPEPHIYIELLYVLPQHRNTLIGRNLLKHAENWASGKGFNILELHTTQDKITYYESLGYRLNLNMYKRLEVKKDETTDIIHK